MTRVSKGAILWYKNFMKQKGFTLIEVLIGVTILTGMSMLIYATMNRALMAKVRVEERDQVLQGARVTMTRMVDDLAQAVLANKNFSGAEEKFTTGLKGGADHVDFSSLSHFHYLKDAPDSDAASIGYYLKSEGSGLSTLMRRESYFLGDKIDEGGMAYPVVEHVKTFLLEYYSAAKTDWVPEWDSAQLSSLGKLPMAVRITLVLVRPDEDTSSRDWAEYPFTTIARVELYKGEVSF